MTERHVHLEGSMRRMGVLVLAVAVSACATAPVSYSATFSPGAADPWACAVQQLNQLGYTVEDASRDAGFARGRKQTSGLGTRLFTGGNYFDVLTVASFADPASSARTLRVTAARVRQQVDGLFNRGAETGESPSDSGKSDATAILSRCTASTTAELDPALVDRVREARMVAARVLADPVTKRAYLNDDRCAAARALRSREDALTFDSEAAATAAGYAFGGPC